jgi:signal transduction histidine kinase
VQKARERGTRRSSRDGAVFAVAAWWDTGTGRVPRAGDGGTTVGCDAAVLTGGDNGSMDSVTWPRALRGLRVPVALGALLGLLAVAELVARLSAKTTLRAGLAAPVTHAGVTAPTALLMCAFCLLATVPAGLLRPVPAALAVYLAAVLSLVLFELVTIAGAAALLVVAYRLARAGSLVLAVALGVPFLALALVLAGTGSEGRTMAVAGAASVLAGAATETRVLAVLLASAIPLATVAAMARAAREQNRTHSAVQEATEAIAHDHLARGERARIARELHDVVAHHISMIAVQAETARLTTPALPPAGAERFAAIGDTARAGLTEMRRLLGVLREDAEQDKETEPLPGPAGPGRPGADRRPQPGLPQLGDLVDGARAASGSVVRLIMSGPVTRLDPGVELAAYRIVQEALTNARRHAPGAAVDVELRYAGDALRLRIRDNGPGQAYRHRSGHGLLGMRERAAAVGGSLWTSDARGGGFCVKAELPAKAPDAMTGAPPERMHQ